MKKVFVLATIAATTCMAVAQEVEEKPKSAPPLPTHCVHGYSGVFITPTAYFANPAAKGEFWGKPSVSATAAFI